jgi:hypothetical protein
MSSGRKQKGAAVAIIMRPIGGVAGITRHFHSGRFSFAILCQSFTRLVRALASHSGSWRRQISQNLVQFDKLPSIDEGTLAMLKITESITGKI